MEKIMEKIIEKWLLLSEDEKREILEQIEEKRHERAD